MARDTQHRNKAPATRRAVVILAWYGALVGGIGVAGWYGWTTLVLPLAPAIDPASPLALTFFGLLAGTAALFAPCALPLFPAYISLYLTLDEHTTRTSRVGRSLWYGLVCGLGAVVFFLLMGVGLSALGSALSRYLIAVKPLIALMLIGAGVATLTDVSLPVLLWPRAGTSVEASSLSPHPVRRLFLYGFGYGLASTGCTLPIYISLVVFPLSSGAFGRALTAFISFAVAMGGLMMLLTLLIGLSKRTLIHHLLTSAAIIRQVSGIALILIGLYVGYYFYTAGM